MQQGHLNSIRKQSMCVKKVSSVLLNNNKKLYENILHKNFQICDSSLRILPLIWKYGSTSNVEMGQVHILVHAPNKYA